MMSMYRGTRDRALFPRNQILFTWNQTLFTLEAVQFTPEHWAHTHRLFRYNLPLFGVFGPVQLNN